jgi:DivIVA domain-containing protein
VDLDRQIIERRDFPIARRGYDPAAVDAHLRALAAAVDELRRRSISGRGPESLGSAAASQVQSILEAAEATATDIQRRASEESGLMRNTAARDAERVRTEAVQRAQAHVEAVSQATAALLARVESMDGEVSALVHSLRAAAGRLASDLGSVETNMGELYDASNRPPVVPAREPRVERQTLVQETAPVVAVPPTLAPPPRAPAPMTAPAAFAPPPAAAPPVVTSMPAPVAPPPAAESPQPVGGGNGDLDGARLVALNMALNGEPRAQADRYLAENFELADRAKLLDEVYAAIEG